MGIDGFWIGYEGTRSGYAKQQGRPADEILTELREHGITVLTSMIVGFDYQNKEVVASEFDGLMKLKPSLAQFLIYGPVPGTPFHERVIRENLLHDRYTTDKDLYYRRADGFTTMMKHPTLSPAEIEEIQQWCFDQDYQRLGPSIFRTMEARLLGYKRLKDSPNPLLRGKAAYYAREMRHAYPIFLAGRLFGPNPAIRSWIGDLEKSIQAELGAPTLLERVMSVTAIGAAAWTKFTLKFNLFQHPGKIRKTYRLPGRKSAHQLWEEIQGKVSIPSLSIHVEQHEFRKQVVMRLNGALSAAEAEGLGQRIRDSLARTKSHLILDLQNLHWDKIDNLKPLRDKLAVYRSRIQLILPEVSIAHPEHALLARLFQAYQA